MSSMLHIEGSHQANFESSPLEDEIARYDVPSCVESKSPTTFTQKSDEREASLEYSAISAACNAVKDSEHKSQATLLASSSSKRSFGRKQLAIVPQRSSWDQDPDCKDFASSVDQPRTSVSDQYEVVPLGVPSSPMLCNKTDDFEKKVQTQLELASVKLSYIAVEM